VSETIIRNLRVLATDQRTDSKGEDGKPVVKTFGNVTFEVTPKIAEKIAVAQSLGQLSLSLRSIADNTSELERMVASGQVKVPAGANPAEERKHAAGDRQPADRQRADLHHRRRRVALPAPLGARPPAGGGRGRRKPAAIGSGASAPLRRRAPLRRVRPDRWSGSPAATMSASFQWGLAKMSNGNKSFGRKLRPAFAALALGARR
jgi:hypothetical protein